MIHGMKGRQMQAAAPGECPYSGREQPSYLLAGLLALLMATGFGVGCKKESAVEPPTSPEENAQLQRNVSPDAPPTSSQNRPQTLNVAPQEDPDAVVKQLNRELARWMLRNKRTPSSFEEFVSSAQLQVPPAPAGKKYVLNKDVRIVLANQ